MNKFSNYVILISLFSFMYAFSNISDSRLYFILLLPLILLILTILFQTTYSNMSGSIVFKSFITQAVIRYCVLTVFFAMEDESILLMYLNYLNISIVVMILELMAIFIVLTIYSKKQKDSFIKRKSHILPLKNIFLLSIVLLIMFLYMYISNSFEKINPIWQLGDYVDTYVTKNEDLEVSTLGILMFTPFKIISALCFISLIYKSKKVNNNNKKWFYLMMIIISNLFIIGTSRLSIILFSMPLLILIASFLKQKDVKKVSLIAISSLILVVAVSSVSKFTRYDSPNNSDSIVSASALNAYFSGPKNIAIGLKSYEKTSINNSFKYLLNDTLQNIPILSKLTADDHKLTKVFNEEIYGHREYADQIVPLTTSGLFHFGYFGVFFYSSFFIIIALFFERLSHKVISIGYRYILIYLSISLSLVFMFNIGSFYSVLSGSFLFIFIPLFLINSFSKLKFN